jgi:hypothetical protein
MEVLIVAIYRRVFYVGEKGHLALWTLRPILVMKSGCSRMAVRLSSCEACNRTKKEGLSISYWEIAILIPSCIELGWGLQTDIYMISILYKSINTHPSESFYFFLSYLSFLTTTGFTSTPAWSWLRYNSSVRSSMCYLGIRRRQNTELVTVTCASAPARLLYTDSEVMTSSRSETLWRLCRSSQSYNTSVRMLKSPEMYKLRSWMLPLVLHQ